MKKLQKHFMVSLLMVLNLNIQQYNDLSVSFEKMEDSILRVIEQYKNRRIGLDWIAILYFEWTKS